VLTYRWLLRSGAHAACAIGPTCRPDASATPARRSEGEDETPDSALAPERDSILIHSLADNEQRSEARGEAERMVNQHPDSDWVREIERFTGAHRHRNVRLNDAGEIEYY
jgi:hypothetical protein